MIFIWMMGPKKYSVKAKWPINGGEIHIDFKVPASSALLSKVYFLLYRDMLSGLTFISLLTCTALLCTKIQLPLFGFYRTQKHFWSLYNWVILLSSLYRHFQISRYTNHFVCDPFVYALNLACWFLWKIPARTFLTSSWGSEPISEFCIVLLQLKLWRFSDNLDLDSTEMARRWRCMTIELFL